MSFFARIFGSTPAPAAPVSKPRAARKPSNSEAGLVRAWARENGIEVGERGRVSAELKAQYAASK